jgi:hypothetical protein
MLGHGPIGSAPLGSLAALGRLYPFPPEESEASYFESLGRFIASYAVAEAGVHEITRSLSKLSEAKGRVIFAGMRLGDLSERIRAMLRTDSVEKALCDDIEACLLHLDDLSEARNKLVHRHVTYAAGQFLVSNMYTAKSREGIQTETFKRVDLNHMEQDCRVIFLRLTSALEPEKREPDIAPLLMLPWRYIPASPAPQAKPPRQGRKSRQRQPGPSRT